MKTIYRQKQNLINHPSWNEFCGSPDYDRLSNLIQKVIEKNEKSFEQSFNTLMPLIEQRYGG